MTLKLKDKVAIITGGADGIGKSTAQLFTAEGATVIVCDIDIKGQAVADELTQQGHKAVFRKVDVTNEQSIKELIEQVVKDYGHLNILVANAGIVDDIPIHELSVSKWDNSININLNGVFLTNKYAIEQMRKQGGGSIVNTASMLGLVGKRNITSYSAAKGGVVNLTRTLGITYAHEGIRINAVSPGYINTKLINQKPSDQLEEIIKLHPIGRLGEPEEVAKAILFLASDDASYICGTCLTVDGGYTAQ